MLPAPLPYPFPLSTPAPRPETPDPEEEEGAEPPDVASLSLDQLLNAVSDSVPSARGSTSGTPAGA